MKKFLKELAIILSVVLLLMIVINYRFGKNYYNHFELQYNEIVEPKKKIEGIILGTSHGTHGIRPEMLDSLGFGFYNFSMNGGNPEFYWNWYTNIFAPLHPRPAYCIWATDWFLFDTLWVWRQYEQDSEYFPDSIFYANVRSGDYNTHSLVLNRIPFTKYKSFKDVPNLFRKYDESQYIISKYKDGFVPYWPKKIERFRNRYVNKLKDFYKISPWQQHFFEMLVHRMMSEGIKVILINTPEYGSKSVEYEKIIAYDYLESFAKKNGISFINYNLGKRGSINDNKDMFTDWGHLNDNGSKWFSVILRSDLDSVMNLYR